MTDRRARVAFMILATLTWLFGLTIVDEVGMLLMLPASFAIGAGWASLLTK